MVVSLLSFLIFYVSDYEEDDDRIFYENIDQEVEWAGVREKMKEVDEMKGNNGSDNESDEYAVSDEL